MDEIADLWKRFLDNDFTCPYCGHDLTKFEKKCDYCGTELDWL